MAKQGVVVSINKAQRAQAAPIGEAILEYVDELYRFALQMTRDAEHARDLTQESILRALQRPNTIVRDLRAWLFQTLYHTFITHYRHGLRQQMLNENWPEDGAALQSLMDPLPAVIAVEDVRSAIEALPEELRTVVWLSDAEQFRLREIAEMLEWPLGTVASRLWRARLELRRLLSAYGPPREKQA